MDLINTNIEKYVEDHTTPENKLLHKINRQTHLRECSPRMLSGHVQGRVLAMLSKMARPKYVLEIGTFTGYSAICLAEGLVQNGELHTIEINEEYRLGNEKRFEQAGFKNKIVQHIGDALSIIPSFNITFDIVFIDADKQNYLNYYELAMKKLKTDGYIIADNVLWSGKVINKKEVQKNEETRAIANFNQRVQQDENVENVMLSVRDGLMVIRKK